MIYSLSGCLRGSFGNTVLVDVNGVGYGVEVGEGMLAQLPATGEDVFLWVFTDVAEDRLRLFGFATSSERALFELLLSVSGVGPKVALAIVSIMKGPGVRAAVVAGNPDPFVVVPRVGKRLAEKILLELKSKSEQLLVICGEEGGRFRLESEGSALNSDLDVLMKDVKSALGNLGFKKAQVDRVVRQVFSAEKSMEFEEGFRASLALLQRSNVQKSVGPIESELF